VNDERVAPTSDRGSRDSFDRKQRLAGLRTWQRFLLSVMAGVAATAALPPLYLIPVLIPAFVVFFLLLENTKRGWSGAFVGWAFGLGYFAAGLHWVGHAFLVDAERFGWAMPFAVAGLAAGMAVFPALAGAATTRVAWRGLPGLFVFTAAWLVSEWLRSWILTGFPWNLLGTVWAIDPAPLQAASVAGVWGLSVLTLLAATAPALLFVEREASGGKWRTAFVCGIVLLPAYVWAGGAVRLAAAPGSLENSVEGVRLRIIQPSIKQSEKWKAGLRQRHLARQMEMSASEGFGEVTHVIWAETAVPFLLSGEPDLQKILSDIVPSEGLLITGAPRRSQGPDGSQTWNSLHALESGGAITATYDKFHLVPFGEYVPLRSILGFAKLTVGSSDFQAGPGLQTLTLPSLPPVSPLICYEVIFPGDVVASHTTSPRPQWLLNLTNDAWFGNSTGPHQHFANARLRAVEEGLPLVRAANNGISAVVDPYGRVLKKLSLNEVGVIDSPLPRPTSGTTLFARLGNWTVAILLIALTVGAVIARRRNFR